MEREKGLEPSTFWLETRSSTIELLPRLGGGTPLALRPLLSEGLVQGGCRKTSDRPTLFHEGIDTLRGRAPARRISRQDPSGCGALFCQHIEDPDGGGETSRQVADETRVF